MQTVIQSSSGPVLAEEIRVRGIVQGVGFRPTVYRLAQEFGLRGEVWNDGQGVVIRAVGSAVAIDTFLQHLQQNGPPLARIESIERTPLTAPPHYPDFQITESVHAPVRTNIAPDAAVCPQCLSDTLDPFHRWYRYPFTNCTHCGPRLSLVRSIPYDRANTSMAAFPMCPNCAEEYHNIRDRRFHAQPVACHHCGPKAWLERMDGKPIVADMFSMLDDVDAVCTLLQRGEIVAIKGIGGFHLACDATHEQAVQTLRQRKHRYHKPFALMARDLALIERYCQVSEAERSLLQSPAAPIVLLHRHLEPHGSDAPAIAPSVAPCMRSLGFMLPYTPLHHLILRRMARPIVLTSGNASDEPQCIDNDTAREKLGAIADYGLFHNRDIVNRVDDSVVRVVQGTPQLLRRARGYAPAPIILPAGFQDAPAILAMGSELKNTFCLLRDGQAILSQHLGDLENGITFEAYQQTLQLYLNLFEHQPAAIAVDAHPDYLSTKLGEALTDRLNETLPILTVQHHHAHVAACMAENGLPIDTEPVLGIALDGLGYGEDGQLWGGEFLLSTYREFQRLASLKPIAMLGGTQAIYQPWRNAYAHLLSAFSEGNTVEALNDGWQRLQQTFGDLELLAFLEQQPRSLLNQMLANGLNSPLASSTGRLFDAVAAALNLCREQVSYEGQAAIQLEALIDVEHLRQAQSSAYTVDIRSTHRRLDDPQPLLLLDPAPLWRSLLQDLRQELPAGLMAARFHVGLAQAIAQVVQRLHQQHPFRHVVLTGGVFQNQILTEQVLHQLQPFTVLLHHHVPANDGGLSLGQAAIAAARLTSPTPY